jgi:outer membrane immunogenic protein
LTESSSNILIEVLVDDMLLEQQLLISKSLNAAWRIKLEGKKMKRILFSFVLLIFIFASMTASAAGPVYNWTGFYAGLQGSYDVGSSDWDFPSGTHTDHTLKGGMGGLYVGYNYQTPVNVVVGIETDINYGGIKGSSTCPGPSFSCNTDVYLAGSTRARVGYAISRFLPYIGVGVAYGRAELVPEQTATGQGVANTTNNYLGWTPSVGIEFAITKNLLARAEYAYYDFSKNSVVFSDGTLMDNKITMQGFKFGLSWKF